MAFTGKLGTSDSRPANIILGGDAPAVGGGGEINESAENELSLVQTLVSNIMAESVASELSLSSHASGSLPEEVSSVLALVQDVDSSIKCESVSSVLSLAQEARSSVHNEHLASVLSLTSVVDQPYIEISLASDLGLVHEVDTQGSEQTIPISNFLSLTDQVELTFGLANLSVQTHLEFVNEENSFLQQFVNLTIDLSVASFLTLTDEAYPLWQGENTLALTHAVEIFQGIDVESVLQIEHEVEVNATWVREVETALDIDHGLTYEVESSSALCGYSPFVGTNGDGDATTPPPVTPPTLTTGTLTLTYPFSMPTTTLVLRNPDFGNQLQLDHQRIKQETRGGTLIVFRDPIWPKITTLKLTVQSLTAQQADDFLDFLAESIGDEIGLLDWEGRNWRGIITTPDAEVTDNGPCDKVIVFEFQGELV